MITNFIDRVKLKFRKRDKDFLKALHDILGFIPYNLEIYRIALSHKSIGYQGRTGKSVNNERLEFLGDAILEAVVSDLVFHRYERKREGFLTSTRSKIVQRSSLNQLSAEMGLDRLIRTNARPVSQHNNIGGNAFEALVGAIYLDRGYAHCKWFIEKRIIGRLLDIDNVAQKEVNFKSKLLEWTQKNRIQAEYRLDKTDKDNNGNTVFYTSVVLEGLIAGKGTGFSKKESHQATAREALMKLRREARFVDTIFEAKEKRTAMEADAVCTIPKIDVIEEELAREVPSKVKNNNISGSRAPQAPAPIPAASKPQVKAQPKKKTPRPAPPRIDEDENINDEKRSAPIPTEKTTSSPEKTRRKNNGIPKNESVKEALSPSPTSPNTTSTDAPSHKPRPNSRRRRAQAAQKQEVTPNDTQLTIDAPSSTEGRKRPTRSSKGPRRSENNVPNGQDIDAQSQAEREAIIRQAEEAAFNEGLNS